MLVLLLTSLIVSAPHKHFFGNKNFLLSFFLLDTSTEINFILDCTKNLYNVLSQDNPDAVIVYGDTNSTLAGGISAKKLNIPVAHIEAGVRNYDEEMPEESNRYLVDRLADMNFCCTDLGYSNLMEEGYNLTKLKRNVSLVGDLMFDAAKYEIVKAKIITTITLDFEKYNTCLMLFFWFVICV